MKKSSIIISILALVMLTSLPVFAKKRPPALHGDVRLETGRNKIDTSPNIVEYQGPCGSKKSISVVNLWKKHVIGATIWLSSSGQWPTEKLPAFAKIVGYKCEFSPKLAIVRPGTVVKIFNNDPYTQWLIVEEDGVRKRQIRQEPEGEPIEITVHKGKTYRISSGFYPWMEAWIRSDEDVVATTETEDRGKFRIEGIPGGEYTLHAWHPSLGETSEDVKMYDNMDKEVDIVYQMPEKVVPVIKASGLERIFKTDGEKERDENPFKK